MSVDGKHVLKLRTVVAPKLVKTEVVDAFDTSYKDNGDNNETISAVELDNDVSEETIVIEARPVRNGSRKWPCQKYRKEWEQDPLFKGWLCSDPDDEILAKCRVCNEKLRARLTVLKNHVKSAKHQRLIKAYLSRLVKSENSAAQSEGPDTEHGGIDDPEPARKRSRTSCFTKVYRTAPGRSRYNPMWEEDDLCKGWLSSVPHHSQLAKCNACNVTMKAHFTKIKVHAKSNTHKRLMEIFGTNSSDQIFDLPDPEKEEENDPPTSEDEEEDKFGSEDEEPPESTATKSQKYRPEWEKNPKYAKWLGPHPENEFLAKCKSCDTEFMSRLCVINKHLESLKHKRIISRLGLKPKEKPPKEPTIAPPPRYRLVRLPHDHEAVRKAESKICAFLDKYNASDTTVSHMEYILKACFPDSSVAKVMNLRRARNATTRKDVRVEAGAEVGEEVPKRIKFSVTPFGVTDIATVEPDSIVVTYSDTPDHLQDVHLSML